MFTDVSTPTPVTARPGRHLGVDVARGLALMTMFVAHTAPWQGVWGNRGLGDSITAPLFAALIGLGLYLSARSSPAEASLVAAGIRATVLLAVGTVLLWMPSGIDVVLIHLAMLTVVAALVVRLPAYWPGIVIVLLAVAGPLVEVGRRQVHGILAAEEGTGALLVNIMAGGAHYRLLTFLVWAILGMAFARYLLHARTRTYAAVAGASVLITVAAVILHRTTELNVHPYTGYPTEILFASVLIVGVLSTGILLAAWAPRVASALAGAGRATLSVYSAHIVFLAVWLTGWGNGTISSWWTLGILVVGTLTLPALWASVLPGRGPIELVVDAVVREVSTRVAGASRDQDVADAPVEELDQPAPAGSRT